MDRFSMKWYKFVIYVQLFLSAIVNFCNAATYFAGLHYQGNAESVYYFFPNMRALDIVMGIFCMALAVFAIVVRQRLAKFKKDGPMLYLILFGIQAALNMLYLSFATGITGINAFDASVCSAIVAPIVLLVTNKVYFEKRKDLFGGEDVNGKEEGTLSGQKKEDFPVLQCEGSVCGVFGTFNGQSYFLRPGQQCTVGSGTACDICLKHDLVSQMHCTVELLPDGVFQVTDYSENGTYYNNQRLRYGEPCQMPSGALLAVGDADNVLELRRREDKTDIYPFIHSRQSDEKSEMKQGDHGSPEIFMGDVYASPEKMGKPESKESL